ncbi:VQ motif-containing protein, partial [Escherichia coli]|nr:VQ motif-containing protein [Escherichia coli]
FRPTLPDSWFADYVVRDAETLTMALQKSISGGVAAAADGSFFPFSNLHNPDAAAAAPTTPTVSGLSDQESAPRRRGAVAPAGATGKVSKRKSRASKRSQTTFITADPANFRQMVQQVTGVRFP